MVGTGFATMPDLISDAAAYTVICAVGAAEAGAPTSAAHTGRRSSRRRAMRDPYR